MSRLLDGLAEEGPIRDAAVARLALIGPRAVTRLIEFATTTRRGGERGAALRALEAIGDARAVEPAAALIDAADLPTAAAATAILRLFVTSPDAGLSTAAIDRLTAAVLDPARAEPLRLAAMDALRLLPDEETGPLFERLREDPTDAVRARASGSSVAQAKVTPLSLDAIADGAPLGDAEALRNRQPQMREAAIATLHRLIGRLREQEAAVADPAERARWTAVRAAVHQVLASRGSRVAVYDLREAVEAGDPAMPMGFLAALRAVGDASCLDAIGAAYVKATASGAEWWMGQLRDTLQEVMEREKLTRRHAAVRRLEARYPGLLSGPLSTPSQTIRTPLPDDRT